MESGLAEGPLAFRICWQLESGADSHRLLAMHLLPASVRVPQGAEVEFSEHEGEVTAVTHTHTGSGIVATASRDKTIRFACV